MSGAAEIGLGSFLLVYLLLLAVLGVMRFCRIDRAGMLLAASAKMSVQLVLAGFVLTALFEHPHPAWTLLYLAAMTAFAVWRVLGPNRDLNRRFRTVTALSIVIPGLLTVAFFVGAVIRQPLLNPQYVIPIAGMVMGNTMTGVALAIRSFRSALEGQEARLEALLCAGAAPEAVLRPFVREALETAMLPTVNIMLGMGIVALPGMMTGQILSGTLPTTAILYQIAILIAICAVVTCASFGALFFGSRTLTPGER